MFADNFCQDVEKTEAPDHGDDSKAVIESRCFEGKITDAAWKKLPSWYVVSLNDRMIPPEAEQFLAQRMNAKTISLPSSHVAMVSHPEEVSEFILSAAKELTASTGKQYPRVLR